ncbi:MAG: ChaN family lipoprotein [Kofleriaceae bacterium]|nr:ChaN family lipoprotein [Kofleriaceae bacterium]
MCVGEDHPNPHHHWFQLEVVSHLAARKPGAKLALGMEMFQRPFQGVLDDYAAHRIDDAALLSRTGWSERWNYDWGFYRPTIAKALAAGAALLALNAPRELTKKVVRQGLESLTPDEKKQVPELNLDDKAHRAWFDDIMENMGGAHAHGGGGGMGGHKNPEPADAKPEEPKAEEPPAGMPSADRVYTVQVIWDESMADGAAKWLAANPSGYLVLLAGNGHCHDSAIVNRIKRRGIPQVVSVHPVLDMDGRVAEALAKPMNDYLVVLELPADVKAQMEKEEAEGE